VIAYVGQLVACFHLLAARSQAETLSGYTLREPRRVVWKH
jgi:hypothetical protein